MAGVNFMALAEGMMLGDELNKKDETYWRKQAKEDRDMMYQERNQAYQEQTQGYALDEYKEKAEVKEAGRFISQASDILSKAAAAQGKQKWQVMLESPEFTVPEGSPGLQSKVQAGIRAGLVATEAMNLRARGDWRNAERLEQHYGMSQRSDVSAMQAYSNMDLGNKRVMEQFPGATVNDKGDFVIGNQVVPRNTALGLTFNPMASGATLINQYKTNEQTAAQAVVTQQGQVNQAAIEASNKRAIDTRDYEYVRQAIANGYGLETVPPHLQGVYTTMKAASPAAVTQTGSPPISSAGSYDAYTAAPASAPVAPAAMKPVAPTIPSTQDWREGLPMSPEESVTAMSAADTSPAFESAVNHFSSQQLEAMRSNITSGKGLPGMSPRATAAALQTINDEIASRHKAQAVRYQRGMKQ